MKQSVVLFVTISLAIISICGAQDDNNDCEYGGETYSQGKTREEDCNTCTCSDGEWACTEIGCQQADCEHEGEQYPHDSRIKEDDCNTCTCSNGEWACTLIACLEGASTQSQPSQWFISVVCGVGLLLTDFLSRRYDGREIREKQEKSPSL
ncbi:uncharacterized protein LOC144453662 [Glandiceps talaboti]